VAAGAERQARQAAEATVVRHYRAEVDEIVQLDANNEAGLQGKYSDLVAGNEIDTKTLELAGGQKWDELETLMKDMLARHKGRKAIEQKATFYLAVAAIESRMDFERGLELIAQAQAIDPDSDYSKHLEGVRKNVERIQQQHGGRKGGDGKPGDGGKGEAKKDGGH
jgi:hypothetical protein